MGNIGLVKSYCGSGGNGSGGGGRENSQFSLTPVKITIYFWVRLGYLIMYPKHSSALIP